MHAAAPDSASELERGRALLLAGDAGAAAAALERAVGADPAAVEVHFLLGASRHALGELAAALAAFDAALARDPQHREAACAAIGMLCALGRADEALARAETLLAAHPHDPHLNYNAALVHEALGDWAAALARYDAALAAAPGALLPLLNRGLALTRLGRPEDAYRSNLELARVHPGLADAHFNLAETCLATGRDAEALAAADRALALDARHMGAALDRALALAALARFDAAQAALARAAALGAALPQSDAGGAASAREIYLVRAYDRLEACDWTEHETVLARFGALINDEAQADRPLASPALAYRAVMLGLPQADQLRLARRTAERIAASAPPSPIAPAVRARDAARSRLRIGYVSSDFRDHPLAHLSAGFFARHDRARFEVFGYAIAPDDASEYRRRIVAGCDRFADLAGAGAADIVRAIAADRIDVLVNLNGYTTGHRTEVFAARPAPVQVSWIGLTATTGADFIDYLIGDAVVTPPEHDRWYAEAVVRLPHCYLVTDAGEAPPPAPPRAAAGLPAAGFVFCDFNQHAKITPELFAAWMRILRRVQGSVLWLLDGPGRANLLAHAAAAGVDAARVVFAPRLPRRQHLARLQLGDLFVDTRPTNAHTTAVDALLAAVPVLTCPGETFAGRVAESIARAADLDALVVADLAAYEAVAVDLAGDRTRLDALRRRLRDGRRTLPVFDTAARVREIEWAYAEMVARHRRGLPPASLEVPPGT